MGPARRGALHRTPGAAPRRRHRRLRSAGYGAASWAGTAAEVDPTPKVRIFVVADSGPLYRAGRCRSAGLQRHAQRIRRLSGLAPARR
jgi:translocation and assembly module TamA